MAETTDTTTATLVRQAAEQISTLVRDELKLAQVELADKGRQAALGVGLAGGAAVTFAYGLGALAFAAGLALAQTMPGWAAALVIAAILLLLGGIQVLAGRGHLRRVTPLAPTRTIQSVRADVDAVTRAVEERNQR